MFPFLLGYGVAAGVVGEVLHGGPLANDVSVQGYLQYKRV